MIVAGVRDPEEPTCAGSDLPLAPGGGGEGTTPGRSPGPSRHPQGSHRRPGASVWVAVGAPLRSPLPGGHGVTGQGHSPREAVSGDAAATARARRSTGPASAVATTARGLRGELQSRDVWLPLRRRALQRSSPSSSLPPAAAMSLSTGSATFLSACALVFGQRRWSPFGCARTSSSPWRATGAAPRAGVGARGRASVLRRAHPGCQRSTSPNDGRHGRPEQSSRRSGGARTGRCSAHSCASAVAAPRLPAPDRSISGRWAGAAAWRWEAGRRPRDSGSTAIW
jgi:hypothetical protein